MACCFHKTQFARHGLECQMSNCRMTKLQTPFPEYFGRLLNMPRLLSYKHSASVCLSLLLQASEGSWAWASCTTLWGRNLGKMVLAPVTKSISTRGLWPQVAENSSSVIFLPVLASSSKGQAENPDCQGDVHLPRPRLVLPSALLTVHLPISTTLCSQHQSRSVHNSGSSRRTSPGRGEYAQTAHVNTGRSSNAYIKQQELNQNCLIFNSHHPPRWIWQSLGVVVSTYFIKTDLHYLLVSAGQIFVSSFSATFTALKFPL